MEKIKKWISTNAYKRIKLHIFFFIIVFNILMVLIGGIIIHVSSPEEYANVGIGMWQIFTDILDPGFIGSQAMDGNGGNGVVTTVEVIVILICMVTFTGTIIGYISNMITQIIENADRGPKQLYLKDHILILNWNNRAAGILSEYLYTEICEDVVILAPYERNVIEKEISNHFYNTKQTNISNHVNICVKTGEPYSLTELDAVCARKAKTVIIISDTSTYETELCTLKTVMMISQITQNKDDCTIIVETDNKNVYELVTQIRDNHPNILPAFLNKIMGKLLAHVALQPELNEIFRELLSNIGSEFYSISVDNLKHIDESSNEDILQQYMQWYNSAIPVIYADEFVDNKTNSIYLLAETISHINKERPDINVDRINISINTNYPIPKKKIIVLGCNSKINYIVNSFQAYIDNYGKEYLTVYFIDIAENLDHAIKNHECFNKILINERYNLSETRDVLSTFNMVEIDTIVILSDDKASPSEYDMGALISLIEINRILSSIKPNLRPELIVEILNPQNYEIVQQYNINNIIISNKYMSSMIAQLGNDSNIFELLYDFLTFDNEEDDFGIQYSAVKDSREIYIKNCSDYFKEIPSFSSKSQMLQSIYHKSGHKDILLGIIYADSSKNPIKDGYESYILSDNLDEQQNISLLKEDKLVIYSSSW